MPMRPPMGRTFWIVGSLLLISLGLMLTSAKVKSATFDEDAYVGKGIAIWNGNYWLQTNHPSLVPIIGTVFLLTEPGLDAPTDHPCWPDGTARSCGRELLFHRAETHRALFLVRLPIALLTVLLIALVYRWAAELYGRHAALLPAALCAFDPNLLAHGRLFTLDLPASLAVLLSCWTFYRFWKRPGWRRLLAAGVALGLAGSTRFTTGFLMPIFLALSLAQAQQGSQTGRFRALRAASLKKRLFSTLALLAMMGGIAAITIWLVHGADFGPVPRWSDVSLPAPAYFNELARLFQHHSTPQDAFLLGRHYKGGWWPYFIVAFLVKTPIPTLIAITLALTVTPRRRRFIPGENLLLSTAGVYYALSLLSPLNLGYRLLLPILPPLLILTGRIVSTNVLPQRLRYLPVILVGWLAAANLTLYPHYLAYFNEIVGPRNGYRVLVDSNLDWGQDLPALEQYVRENDIPLLYLSWFGESRPWQYEIPYRFIPSKPDELTDLFTRVYHPDYPPPGTYAISATNLQALLFDDKTLFAWFLRQEPVAQPGYSILVYEVPRLLDPDAPPVAVALGGVQIDRVPPAAFETLWRTNDLRLRWFDPDTSCLLPVELDGWYVLKTKVSPAWCPFWEGAGPTARLPTRGGSGQMAFYRLRVSPAQRIEWVRTVSSASPLLLSDEVAFAPGDAPDLRRALFPPVRLGDRLEFLGYHVLTPTLQAGKQWEMTTYWRALADDSPPLKIFVQVLDDGGNVRSQYDGLDVPAIGWRAGDLIVQHHTLSIPADLDPGRYWVQVGVYNAQTVARLPVIVDGEAVGSRILLPPTEVSR